MLRSKASKFAICATVCLLGIGATRSAHAQALGGGVNNDGQIVGYKYTILEDPDGFETSANGINAEGQSSVITTILQLSDFPTLQLLDFSTGTATVFTINDPAADGGFTVVSGINDAGQIVGTYSNNLGVTDNSFLYSRGATLLSTIH